MALRLTFERWPANALGYGRHQIRGHHKRVAAATEVVFLSVPRLYFFFESLVTAALIATIIQQVAVSVQARRGRLPRPLCVDAEKLDYKYQDKCSQYAFGFQRPSFAGQNKTVATKRLRNYSSKLYRGEALFNITRTPPAARKVLGAWPIFSRESGPSEVTYEQQRRCCRLKMM